MKERHTFFDEAEELSLMTKMMTLEEYKDCRESYDGQTKFKIKITKYRESIAQ